MKKILIAVFFAAFILSITFTGMIVVKDELASLFILIGMTILTIIIAYNFRP
jgi:hypothetical protein